MDDRLGCLMDKVNRMKPLNPVLLELLAALKNSSSRVADLEAIIETDANTSATILKIANSPFYGLSRQIRSIQEACVLLGYNQLRNVIYASALDQLKPNEAMQNWGHGLMLHTQATAIIARTLAQQNGTHEADSYASGLLHALGKQVVLAEFPEEFAAYMDDQSKEHQRGFEKLFSSIGQMVANNWHLPPQLNAAIRFHRNPNSAPSEYQSLVCLVCQSNRLAVEFGYPSPGESGATSHETVDDPLKEEIKTQLDRVFSTHEG